MRGREEGGIKGEEGRNDGGGKEPEEDGGGGRRRRKKGRGEERAGRGSR
jgi:hypothetical protein